MIDKCDCMEVYLPTHFPAHQTTSIYCHPMTEDSQMSLAQYSARPSINVLHAHWS